MKNEYESAMLIVIGNAHDVILGAKEPVGKDSPDEPFLLVMDDDE